MRMQCVAIADSLQHTHAFCHARNSSYLCMQGVDKGVMRSADILDLPLVLPGPAGALLEAAGRARRLQRAALYRLVRKFCLACTDLSN